MVRILDAAYSVTHTTQPWELVFFIMILLYTPFAVYQLYLIIVALISDDHHMVENEKRLSTPNNVIVAITTNGMATDVVEKIIKKIRSYRVALEIYVVKEAHDHFNYGCRMITVPADYKTAKGSKCKMRAMQYGIEELHRLGYGKETYICHLDDDSIVDKKYLEYVRDYLTKEGAQGCIRLRAFGRHLLSSMSDIIRIANCEAWCRHCNLKNKPQFVHGEGIVIRADVEYEIGWDYATYGAEDLIMGLKISEKYTFGHIPMGNIFIAPPTTARDYYKQRRRWFWSLLHNDGVVRRLSFKTWFFYMYMYFNGVAGLILLAIFPFMVFFADGLSNYIVLMCIINFVNFYAYYQFGALHMRRPSISVLMFLLQIPVAFYDGFTILYSLVKRPDFNTFETIKKV
ncbi:MAG: glycosyltransferase family 2 protein [archaeon]|nr:glycosyltransferase family 2 protein [archaeon]